MSEPRIDKITYTMRRGTPHRKLKEGDEKYVKGVLMVRQQMYSFGRAMVSSGRPVWEWVQWGSERDRGAGKQRGRYRTLRNGMLVPNPPKGWKVIESGRPVPAGYMVFIDGCGDQIEPGLGWREGETFHGFEATYEGERRAFAIRQTKNDILRDLFEATCTCKQRKRPVSESANVAVKKYMSRCKCEVKRGIINATEEHNPTPQ